MRTVVSLLIMSAFVLPAAALASPGALDDVTRVAVPGPYTGPSEAVVPPGWTSWASLSADSSRGEDMPQCGDLKLVFRNPDLRPNDKGFVEAQGSFFIQFQAVGTGADAVTRFAFSFGATHDSIHSMDALNCNASVPSSPAGKGTAGAYLAYYRSDYDARDGFFVPILTPNVPDGTYGAAVHAYNAAGDEIARAWAKAVVANCPGENVQYCTNSAADLVKNDRVQPWPMVLPGDGEQTNGVNGLTIEFGEFVQSETVAASINGLPLDLQEWENPERDSDLQPLNDPDNAQHPMAKCTQEARNVCDRMDYGDGFKWEGQVLEGDVIRVSARDMNGNLAVKSIVYGATSGGTVDATCPVVEWELLSGDSGAIKPGNKFEFPMRIANVGSDNAHVNLLIFDEAGAEVKKGEYTQPGWTAKWVEVEEDHGHVDLVHSEIASGEQNDVKILAETHNEAVQGTYKVRPVLEYDCNGVITQRELPLFLTIDESATGGFSTEQVTETTTGGNETTAPIEATTEDSPAAGLALLVATLFGIVVLARRRRA